MLKKIVLCNAFAMFLIGSASEIKLDIYKSATKNIIKEAYKVRTKDTIFSEELRDDLIFLATVPNTLGHDAMQQIQIEEAAKLAQAILNFPKIKSSNVNP